MEEISDLADDSTFATLFEDFPELLRPDVDLHKELLAHFGLLFSSFALLEAALQNLFIIGKILQRCRQVSSFPRVIGPIVMTSFGRRRDPSPLAD